MKKRKANIRDLQAHTNRLPISDLQKIKGGFGDPPPIGQVPVNL